MKLHTIYRVSTSEGSPKVETVLLPGEILRWCSFNDETFYRNSFYATDRLLPLWIEVPIPSGVSVSGLRVTTRRRVPEAGDSAGKRKQSALYWHNQK